MHKRWSDVWCLCMPLGNMSLMRMCRLCFCAMPEQSIFRVANESGQVLLLLSLIAIGREIGKEIQVRETYYQGGNIPIYFKSSLPKPRNLEESCPRTTTPTHVGVSDTS